MAELKRFTLAEVATRNGRNSTPVYIVYQDLVYDVTNYIHEHPGGADAILGEAGTDATKAINSVGHSSDALLVMAKYKIGEIVEEEKKYDANGKKKKRLVAAAPEDAERGLCNTLTCGLMG